MTLKIDALYRRLRSVSNIHVLLALCAAHCLNDLLQSVVTAVYPMLKSELNLDFTQIGLITLVYQIAASIFQPVVGYAFDKRPFRFSLPVGMTSTAIGTTLFATCSSLAGILVAVFLIGMGSATLHPEASRITSLAGRGHRGFAQSVFQVGGNFGGSIGPLLVAIIVAPHDRLYVLWFLVASALCFAAMKPIVKWYGGYIRVLKTLSKEEAHIPLPLSRRRTVLAICVIVVLIFSKYIYMTSLQSYYTFYLIERFGVSVSQSQMLLFVFTFATAAGTLVGGPVGDRIGRKAVIWVSILGTAPFSLLMPHVSLPVTAVLSFGSGFMLSSAFPSILLYAQELLPNKLGLVSGLFFGFAFGVGGICAAILGEFADHYGIITVYNWCAFSPLLGIVAAFLPNLRGKTGLR